MHKQWFCCPTVNKWLATRAPAAASYMLECIMAFINHKLLQLCVHHIDEIKSSSNISGALQYPAGL